MSTQERLAILKEPWRSMTLPGLVKGAAVLRPGRLTLADSANSTALCGRPARKLTASQLHEEAQLLAKKLTALGLKHGEVVLVQLPNTVEATIGIVGVLLAGAVPAMMPVFEDEAGLSEAVGLTQAAGLLTMARFAGLPLAENARKVAVACDSIRFIAAFGERAPDGVAALDSWNTVEFIDAAPKAEQFAGTDDALITFDRTTGVLRALVRTHEHLIAEASAAAAVTHIAADSKLIVTLPPVTVAGAVYGVVAPLLTGASAELNALFDSCDFAAQLGSGKGMTVVLPASAEVAFANHCTERAVKAETLIFISRPTATDVATAAKPRTLAARTLDAVWLGESHGWLSRRSGQQDPRQARQVVSDLFTTSEPPIRYAGTAEALTIAGPLTPREWNKPAPEALETGFPAAVLEALARPAAHSAKAHISAA